MKTALITGIAGQDGSYLAELLLGKSYRVFGTVRRCSVSENQSSRIQHLLEGNVEIRYGDVLDPVSLRNVIEESQPDEIYHLASQSHVGISFDVPRYTLETNGLGTFNVLEAFRFHAPHARFYFAASSEMFGRGVDADRMQRETTRMDPTSPYGIAKVMGYNLTRHYRRAYGLFATCGILFNHESPRRGANFVTAKVIRRAVEIYQKKAEKLVLGNLDSQRDWGHSKDYVRAMWMMLQHDKPDDWVVATGKTRSVRDLCQLVFMMLGLDYRKHVEQDERFMRPEELPYLRGDSSKIRQELGWLPAYSYENMVREMVQAYQILPVA
jgi:GDPmannose 4,6-dehydratase